MNKNKIKVGSVSYLNAKPLIFGFEKGMMKNEIELLTDYPSAIAQKLIDDTIDIGLVPIAILPLLKEYYFVADYCIGCEGEVASVCLFSDVPLNEIKTIFLDYQSETSVALLKILLKSHWNIDPVLIEGTPGYENKISGSNAGLVIGDRSFNQFNKSTYRFDLGLAWKEMTGLPFVFAAWISNKKLAPEFCERFNSVTATGLQNLDEIISENVSPLFNLMDYYTRFIKFKMNLKMHEAIALFLDKLKTIS